MCQDPDNIESDEPVTVFECPRTFWNSPIGYIVLSVACLLLAVASILLVGQEFVVKVAFGTFFTLFLILLGKAWMAHHTPHTVIVGEQGMVLVYQKAEMSHPWTDFSHAFSSRSGLSQQQCLTLYDDSGRRITKLSDDIDDFETMVKIVQRNITDSRAKTEKRVALERSWFLAGAYIVTGCALGPTACFFAWLAIGGFGDYVKQSEGVGDILGYILFLGMWLFGIVMAILFVTAGVMHLARLGIKRSPSGSWFVFEREPEY